MNTYIYIPVDSQGTFLGFVGSSFAKASMVLDEICGSSLEFGDHIRAYKKTEGNLFIKLDKTEKIYDIVFVEETQMRGYLRPTIDDLSGVAKFLGEPLSELRSRLPNV